MFAASTSDVISFNIRQLKGRCYCWPFNLSKKTRLNFYDVSTIEAAVFRGIGSLCALPFANSIGLRCLLTLTIVLSAGCAAIRRAIDDKPI